MTKLGILRMVFYVISFMMTMYILGYFNDSYIIPIVICLILRMIFLIWLMYFLYSVLRKQNKSIAFIYTIGVMLVSVMIDMAVESVSIISYSSEAKPVLVGLFINAVMLLFWRRKAMRCITKDEIL